MKTENYLVIENNVVTNIVVWDGSNDWTPPTNATMLVQATTPAMVWECNMPLTKPPTFTLQEVLGAGQIGFTWDGTVLTTNQPEPSVQTA
jgi:hypothetical protein